MVLLPMTGLVIGSFLALVSVRLPAGHSIIIGRSRCPKCARILSPTELIPVFSYLLLRRRCSSCREPISRRYVVIEMSAAVVALTAGYVFQSPQAIAAAILGWTLLILLVLDVEHFWLPDLITLPLVAAGLAFTWLHEPQGLAGHILGAAAGYLLFTLVRLAYRHVRKREGLGGGDGKLFAASGAWLGWEHLPFVLLLGTSLALLFVLFMLRTKTIDWSSRLPFGAFLCVSTWLLYLAQPLLQSGR